MKSSDLVGLSYHDTFAFARVISLLFVGVLFGMCEIKIVPVWYSIYMDLVTSSYGIVFSVAILIFSIVIHEVAHGYVAHLFGDDTALRVGRLTLNPLPHIDILGSIIVPVASVLTTGAWFGWAKPVPYNPHNLKGRYAEAAVAAAGVTANIALAVTVIVITKLLSTVGLLSTGLIVPLFTIIVVNFSLAFFNLIPVPPFDGMGIITGLFPRLRISSRVVYNPLFMIMAILLASSIFDIVAPHLFVGIEKIFGM